MTKEEKLQIKRREAAAKLSRPRPVELPSGAWRCQVMVDGERISVIDEDPEIAHAKALALKAGLIARTEKDDTLTLAAAMNLYIENRSNVLSPATIRSYRAVEKGYFDDLKKRLVETITESDIQQQINKYSKDKAYKTVKNAVSFLIAVVSCYKPINLKRLKFPQRIPKEHAFLEGEDISKLIDACRDNIAEIPILFALWLGMRRSEICALDWEDIDFEAKKVHITKALVPNEDNKFVLKNTTKTEGSRRVLDCPDYILERLKAIQPNEAKRTGRLVKINPNDIYRRLKDICDTHGIPFVGVHGLRHTNASVMLSLGIADKVAMARGGWSSKETMQNIYQHLFSNDKSAADALINQYFLDLVNPKERKPKDLHTELHTPDADP